MNMPVRTPASYNAAIVALTEQDLGLAEWPGAKHNPEILQMWERLGINITDDETAWCAGYVGSRLAALGIPHSGKPNARSYLPWGSPVSLDYAVPGDVVVFWRGSPSSWQGHVAFFVRVDGDRVIVRGGNQGNKVSDAPYPVSRVLGVRRWDGNAPQTPSGRPTLRMGNSTPDAFVKVAQEALESRGYFSGAKDGLFGPRTRAAVLAFQADEGLVADGVVGALTWEALHTSETTRPEREVSGDDLAARGSRTVATSRTARRTTEGVTLATASAWVLSNAESLVPTLNTAEGVLGRTQALVSQYWLILAIIGAGAAAWLVFRRFEALRVEDARTGANDRL